MPSQGLYNSNSVPHRSRIISALFRQNKSIQVNLALVQGFSQRWTYSQFWVEFQNYKSCLPRAKEQPRQHCFRDSAKGCIHAGWDLQIVSHGSNFGRSVYMNTTIFTSVWVATLFQNQLFTFFPLLKLKKMAKELLKLYDILRKWCLFKASHYILYFICCQIKNCYYESRPA